MLHLDLGQLLNTFIPQTAKSRLHVDEWTIIPKTSLLHVHTKKGFPEKVSTEFEWHKAS